MFLIKRLKKDTQAERYERQRLMRLKKLENGVKNYSGGIFSLHERVNVTLLKENHHSEATTLLLKDISVYLRDLIIVGQLEREGFSQPEHKHIY